MLRLCLFIREGLGEVLRDCILVNKRFGEVLRPPRRAQNDTVSRRRNEGGVLRSAAFGFARGRHNDTLTRGRNDILTCGPLRAQVLPLRIGEIYQGEFLDSQPTLNLLFSHDCRADVAENLHVNQVTGFVTRGKAWQPRFPVLDHAPLDVVCDAGIQGVRGAGHDVDVVGHGTVISNGVVVELPDVYIAVS
jgi:hypothetical protein